MNRNELCACGSGKRFKHCHGSVESAAPSALHLEALAAHQSGLLGRAEALYRQAIQVNPLDVDSLHMLGVVQFLRRRRREALDLLWDAAERTGWNNPIVRQNLGLVLAHLLSPQANQRQEALVDAYVARTRALKTSPAIASTVSVVLPVYNHARSVARAIASVAAQTYADIELVVVDDGSTDNTAAVLGECLSGLAFPVKLIRREHRGAAQAANQGAEHADGRYLAFLGADDWFAPDRIERMVAEIARAMPLWGFSQVTRVDGDGSGETGSRRLDNAVWRLRDFPADEPVSFTLLKHDVSASSGNLFIEKSLFHELGGYRDSARHRGWDLCVRAAEAVEPALVVQRLYFLAGKDSKHLPAASSPATGADERMAAELLLNALTGDAAVANEFCPQFLGNRDLLLRSELRAARGDRIPVPMLRALAAAWRALPVAPLPRQHDTSAPGPTDKIALVILGMYRSGTSAISRALNLCGAFLPRRVMPAKLGLNPKGFWESEAVTDLDLRLLHHLGGDWNRVDFELPHAGPLVDEFLADSREVLATEYEDAPFILIKDPRICVLAPLWHRALKEGGYRPVYVVVVRHPLEVARSIEAQGGMPVSEGLSLWLTYMRRVEMFVDASDADVVHVRYTQLLDDWRSIVQWIAHRLDVPLAIEPCADEVDRFLEADMRNHQATDMDLDAHLAGEQGEAISALYRRLLERCERAVVAPQAAAHGQPLRSREAGSC
jgi:hypothetical protein